MPAFFPHKQLINLSFLIPPVAQLNPLIFCRYESSARRTTKRLRVKPEARFGSPIPEPEAGDHVIFNPPSSVPSPYHTPQAFLPNNDPRRILLAQSHSHGNSYDSPNERLPPPVRKRHDKKYHLNSNDIETIRQLRSQNPHKWTRRILAEKYECSQFFVGMICEAPPEKKEAELAKLEAIKAKWGRRKTRAREDRTRRRELWGRDR